MKKLFLLRHAKSDWHDESLEDIARPLNDRGRESAKALGAYLAKKGIRPDFILCSPAVRARQTFQLLAPALDDIPVEFEEKLYLFDFRGILGRIAGMKDKIDSLMVIGHNPATEDLMAALTGERRPKYPTCTLAGLTLSTKSWKDIDAGTGVSTGTLDLFIRPKDL